MNVTPVFYSHWSAQVNYMKSCIMTKEKRYLYTITSETEDDTWISNHRKPNVQMNTINFLGLPPQFQPYNFNDII